MKAVLTAIVVTVLAASLINVGVAVAAEAVEPRAVVDKAIRALGGAEALAKVKAFSQSSKGTVTINGATNPISLKSVIGGPDQSRGEFEGEFDGNTIQGVTVLSGEKAWRRFMGEVTELNADAVANEKRQAYLALVSVTVLPLTDAKVKLEAVAEEQVADKPAVGLKVTPADGKEFRIYFDKKSGLPVRLVAKALDFEGNELTQETTLGEYKAIDGIQKATKIASTRDGEKFLDVQVTEFRVIEKADPKAFEEPK